MEYKYEITPKNETPFKGMERIDFSFSLANFKNKTKAFLNLGLGNNVDYIELTEKQIRNLSAFVNDVVNNKRIKE